jgi:DNA-binding LytR/AlgR family response regulator
MSKILIIEDEQRKLDHLKEFLNMEFPDIEFEEKHSYNSALKEIVENHKKYDLLLLDMSMTTYDVSVEESGGVPEPLAGENILDAMYLNEIPTKVIVVTMYESFVGKKLKAFDIELKENYPDNYLGFVFFSHKNTDWRTELKKYINSTI